MQRMYFNWKVVNPAASFIYKSALLQKLQSQKSPKIIPLRNNQHEYLKYTCIGIYIHEQKELYENGPIILWLAMIKPSIGKMKQ